MSSTQPTEVVVHTLCALCYAAIAAATAGCTTTLSGNKATITTEGLVYYLPAPHFYLAPQADGSITIETKYLPDRSNAYTLRLGSYFSKATFEVGTSNGLLTTVNLDADTSGVAASVAAGATEIRKARITAAQTKETANKTQEEAKRTAVKTAAEALATQREKVQLLEAKQKFYDDNPPKEGSGVDLLALKLEISQEKLKLAQLEARLGLIKDSPNSAFNDPGFAATESMSYGPMLFRMLSDGEGVKLVAVGDQITIPLRSPLTLSGSVKATPAKFVFRKADTQRDVVIELSESVKFVSGEVKIVNPALGATAAPVLTGDKLDSFLSPDGRKLTIRFPETLASGRYRIDVDVTGLSNKRQQISVMLEWLLD